MPSDPSRELTGQPSPNISADFLTGSTEIGLDRIRTRLLDLTNRNKLLNYRYPLASCLRVVGASIDQVYLRLRDNEKVSFVPVPEPDTVADDLPNEKDYADGLGWNTSYDLDHSCAEAESGRFLPVLHYPEHLDTLSRKIGSAAKTAIEESGTNMLHLVFGFLEWYEADDSKQAHFAPLVTLPVTLERTSGRGKAMESVLEYSGEDVESNLSLAEKMRRDFGLEIPLLGDDDTPARYFEHFGEILNLKKRWCIRRQITLALLSFGKLLMYRDLDPKNWPSSQNISKHPLVRGLFEGLKSPNIALAEEYPIDAPELKQDLPCLIRDADSSQHSALLHALRGQNLVVEGPPGTGKSQTITNLIAAVLAKGKTVLFVSEKLAALEVVRRRLDDAGLGLFCLEVHSHKTKKGALLSDVAQRYQARSSFKDPRELDRYLATVEEKKQLLTKYASLINETVQPFNATIFELLWARERWAQENLQHQEKLAHLLLPAAVQYDRTQFVQAEHFLSIYAQHLASVLASCSDLEQHPWAWIAKPLSFAEEEEVVRCLEELQLVIKEATEIFRLLDDQAGISLARSLKGLESTAYGLTLLPEPGGVLIEGLLSSCQSSQSREAIADFILQVEVFRSGVARLSESTANAHALLDASTARELTATVGLVSKWALDVYSVAQTRELLKAAVETTALLEKSRSAFEVLLTTVGCDADSRLSTAGSLLRTLGLVENAPLEFLHMRHATFENQNIQPTLKVAHADAMALQQENTLLAAKFDLSACGGELSPDTLVRHSSMLEQASLLQRWFSRRYSQAVNAYRRVAVDRLKVSRYEMSARLRTIEEHYRKRNRFNNSPAYIKALGPHFQGVDSAWDDLKRLTLWYERVFVELPDSDPEAETFRRFMFTARIERLRGIQAAVGALSDQRAILEQSISRVSEFVNAVPSKRTLVAAGSFDQVIDCIREFSLDLSAILQAANSAKIAETTRLRDLPDILSTAGHCRASLASVGTNRQVAQLLGDAFQGTSTAVEPIGNTVRIAESIASGALPKRTAEWLLCHEYQSRLILLRSWLTDANRCAGAWNNIMGAITSAAGARGWNENTDGTFGFLQALAQHSLENRQLLSEWSHFLRLRIQSKEGGLDRLTTLADSRALEPQKLVQAYNFCFYNTLARSVFAERGDLSQITGVTQDLLRQQFASADREAIRLYSERVAALIDRRPIPGGNQSGPVRTWSEMALLTNEMNKQKRHIPIRQLMLRAANALVALKPCFMMGPLSVAQYLAPGQIKFDLVVMDEASQLKPEDAIGALARGGQVVIVGDPKQLPPTTFFQRVAAESEDDEDSITAVEEGESILDVASTLFQPVRRLRWHYRSRHHSLIAFSNNEFYGDLIIFPSAYHDDPSLGVKHHFVPDGMFDNGRNPREAAVVVEAVLEHMREHPNESLGLVTLNFEQRELVEELLDVRLREEPAAIAFQEHMKGGQETFFVKNLENVQGDERDVVFISTTYGPDARGNQYQRFGPINGANGHRRLNVLFTRAKKRTVVFSSLDPDRLQTTANSPWGLRALKQYLVFARSGILQQPDHGTEQAINDFERAVGAVLKEKGYEVVPQVGVAGFFIDLGVRHPTKPGSFLLGIECDGASYHSGKSARDRDRLRQEILENLGWKLHRIWSTDWFKSRESEIRRLISRIEKLLEGDPGYLAERAKAQRFGLLRQTLINLRESEIKPDFPESPLESGLLRKSLLDQFVETRPKTRDEWFRKIPQDLRVRVESKQVAKYLDRVLEIIAESEK
jgi:very-short-patch-repair endonuclease